MGLPLAVRKQLTGEPVAGELPSGFGWRGRRAPFPTPIRHQLSPLSIEAVFGYGRRQWRDVVN